VTHTPKHTSAKFHELALEPNHAPRPPTAEQSPVRDRKGMEWYRPSDWDFAVLNLGGGVKLYSESHFLREFAKFGFTRRGFRSLLRRLGVPLIEFPNGKYFVNPQQLRLAFHAISRLGRPSFIATPGVSRKLSEKFPGTHTAVLEPDYLTKNLDHMIAEMVAARLTPGKRATKDMIKSMTGSADQFQLASANLYAIRKAAMNTRTALRLADEKGVIFDASQRPAQSRVDTQHPVSPEAGGGDDQPRPGDAQ
jgi:hypothetical protein